MTKPPGSHRRLGGVRLRLPVLPITLALLIVACSASPGASTPASASPAGSAARPSAGLTGLPGAVKADYSGILSFDDIEGGCSYLQAADGRKLQVIYPDGWELRKAPLELIAPDGTVHSKAGELVSVNGSEAQDIATICQIGPVIQATEVLPH